MSKTHLGAVGKMQLSCEIKESASGHVEEDNTLSFEGSNDDIILIETYEFSHILKTSQNAKEEIKYKISVSKLVEFIKENGTRII